MFVQAGLKWGTKFIYPVKKNDQNKQIEYKLQTTLPLFFGTFICILLFRISGKGKIFLSTVDLHLEVFIQFIFLYL